MWRLWSAFGWRHPVRHLRRKAERKVRRGAYQAVTGSRSRRAQPAEGVPGAVRPRRAASGRSQELPVSDLALRANAASEALVKLRKLSDRMAKIRTGVMSSPKYTDAKRTEIIGKMWDLDEQMEVKRQRLLVRAALLNAELQTEVLAAHIKETNEGIQRLGERVHRMAARVRARRR